MEQTDTATATALSERDLRAALKGMGLDPERIWQSSIDAPPLEQILDWARSYRACPNRRKLEVRGYVYPPVEPGWDPNADWFRFERWMKGQPLTWSLTQEFGPLPVEDGMTDGEVSAELNRLCSHLLDRGVCVDIVNDAVPDRDVYHYLRTELADANFDYLPPDALTVISGCTGWCEDCFQGPWCDAAGDMHGADAPL